MKPRPGPSRTLRCGLVVAAAPVVVLAMAMMRVHIFGRRATDRLEVTGDTVVVFGARAFEDEPGRILRARLDHALELYRRGCVQRFAMAGGVPTTEEGPSGGHDEVPVMVAYALRAGVPAERILTVRPGQNTRGQVSSVRRVVVDGGLGPVVAVSSSYHLARIHDEARRQGFGVTVSAPGISPDVTERRLYVSHVFADALAGMFYMLPPALAEKVNTSAGTFRHMGLLALTGDVSWRTALRSLWSVTPRGSTERDESCSADPSEP